MGRGGWIRLAHPLRMSLAIARSVAPRVNWVSLGVPLEIDPEIIKHGQNGLLSNEVEELQRYIDRVESDPDLAKELGSNAQQTIREQYSLSRFTDSWNDLFYNTINNYKG